MTGLPINTYDELYNWLVDLFFYDRSGPSFLDPLRPAAPQILDHLKDSHSEAPLTLFRSVVGDIMKRWPSLYRNIDEGFDGLLQVSLLSLHTTSRSGPLAAMDLLLDPDLENNESFVEDCADVLIQILLSHLHVDELFANAQHLFFRPPYSRYRPTIFFGISTVRRFQSPRYLHVLLETIRDDLAFFDIDALTVRYWELFSAQETASLLEEIENPRIGALFIDYFIETDSSPVALRPLWGPDNVPRIVSEEYGELGAGAYYLVDRKTYKKLVDTPIRNIDAVKKSESAAVDTELTIHMVPL